MQKSHVLAPGNGNAAGQSPALVITPEQRTQRRPQEHLPGKGQGDPSVRHPNAHSFGNTLHRGALNSSASLSSAAPATTAQLSSNLQRGLQRAAGSRLQTAEQGRGAGAKAALASFKTMFFSVFHSILYDCTSGFLKDQPETSIAVEQPVTGGAWAAVWVSLITF